jgi:uncharacterized protein YbjT (DUF2867 family)
MQATIGEAMTTRDMSKPTLVLGGTGKTGRRIAARLEARGLPVRVGSRSGSPPFDWEDESTWPAALEGAGAAYISYYPDIVAPGGREKVGSFAELAVRSGVSRLVLMAGRGEPEADEAERAVQAVGGDLTILRPTWFNQNFSEGGFGDLVRAGVVALPAGETPDPFIDADDIADVAVAAFTDDAHIGEIYELTGPRLLTFEEAVGEIAAATGREIEYVPVSVDEHLAALAEYGVPEEARSVIGYLFTTVLDGRNAHLADGVQRALGRDPRDFAAFAREAAASGAWDPVPVAS